jgi:PleD family two-component response regulator
MSGGVATLRADESSDTFLARADGALYAAKARGRNRITSA